MESEKDSLPVNVRRSKTSLLKLPNPPSPPPPPQQKKRSRAPGDEAAIIDQAKERLRDRKKREKYLGPRF